MIITRKVSFIPGIIVILVAIIILIGGVFIYQHFAIKNYQKTSNIQAADQTAGWKTYTDEKYGLNFKYPSDWVSKILNAYNSDNLDNVLIFNSKTNKGETMAFQLMNSYIRKTCGSFGGNSAFKDARAQYLYLFGCDGSNSRCNKKEISIDNFKAELVDYKEISCAGESPCYFAKEKYDKASMVGVIICNSSERCFDFLLVGPVDNYADNLNFIKNIFIPNVNIDSKFNELKCVPSFG